MRETTKKRQLPSLNAIRAFEAAARHCSITRAAQELSVTHSAVSRHVKTLEEQLGVTLVRRAHREIVLTPEGASYFPDLQIALERISDASARISRKSARHVLTVNVLPTFAMRWLIPRLSGFCAAHPNIDVQIATTSDALDFNPSEFDVSIRSFSQSTLGKLQKGKGWSEVKLEPMLDEDMFPVCSPALAKSGRQLKRPSDLRHFTLLHSRSAPTAWADWLEAAGVSNVDPSRGPQFDHFHFVQQAAIQGLGVAMSALVFVADDIGSGSLAVPFPGVVARKSRYYVIYSEVEAKEPAISAFAAWLLEQSRIFARAA